MDSSHISLLVDLLQTLPPDGTRRAAALQRMADVYSAAEAMAAVRAAAESARAAGGPLADALSASAAAWDRPSADGAALFGPASDSLRGVVASDAFFDLVPGWIAELREIAAARPGTGACTVASAMQLWLWTMNHFRTMPNAPATAVAELCEAFASLLAARCHAIEIASNARRTGTPAFPQFDADLCHVHAARAAGAVAGVCAELVFGYRKHLAWDAEGCAACYGAEALDELEGLIPGIASGARGYADVIEADGSHPKKAGPCAKFDGVDAFTRLRARLDGCLTGARLAKDRVAAALPAVLSELTTAAR
jgi:hypothetical protein